MRLTREEVEHVALLGRLELTEQEKEQFTVQLNSILGHFEQLSRLDTSEIPPTSHAVPIPHSLREDEVAISLQVNEVLSNAPDPAGECFRVPRVVEAE